MSSTLRKVFRFRDNVDRTEMRKLWTDGKVCGMFNIPNDAVFDACVDFCIEPTSDDLLVTHAELENLKRQPKLAAVQQQQQQQQQQHESTPSVTDATAPLEKTIQSLTKQLDDLKESFASKVQAFSFN
jgi:hypothetical protein